MTVLTRWYRFGTVSAAGFALQLAAVGLLSSEGVHVVAATAVGVAAAVVHNFAWHARWTWVDRPAARASPLAAFLRFAAANGTVSLAGNVVLVALLTELTALGAVPANVVAVAGCSFVNYWCGDRIVFGPKRGEIQCSPAWSPVAHATCSHRRNLCRGPGPGLRDVRTPGVPLARPRPSTPDAGR